MVEKAKLNYRFHNPNTEDTTKRYIEQILVQAGADKLAKAVENSKYYMESEKVAQ